MLLFATFNSSWEFLKWEAYGREFPSGRTHSSLTIASAILHRVIFFLFPSEVQFENSKKKKKYKRNYEEKPKTQKDNNGTQFRVQISEPSPRELRLNFLPHLQDHWSSLLSEFALTSSSFAKKRFLACLKFTSAAPWLRWPALHRFPWQ